MILSALVLLALVLSLFLGWVVGYAKGSSDAELAAMSEEEAPAAAYPDWHPIEDNILPPHGQWVLVVSRSLSGGKDQVRISRRDIQGEWTCGKYGEVVAWAELPKYNRDAE